MAPIQESQLVFTGDIYNNKYHTNIRISLLTVLLLKLPIWGSFSVQVNITKFIPEDFLFTKVLASLFAHFSTHWTLFSSHAEKNNA